ncbi:MAG: DNA modification methylase [Rhodospirillaceae bacterium]|nr:DNA modification methylase [Rhodospirillaceae bacterium]
MSAIARFDELGGSRDRGQKTNQIFRVARVERRKIADLKFFPHPLQHHPDKDIAKISRAYEAYGEVLPVLIDEESRVLDGEARIKALQQLGYDDVTVVQIAHLTPAQKGAFRIAVNNLGKLADLDPAAVAIQLSNIAALDPAFDYETTTLDMAEIDILLEYGSELSAGGKTETVAMPDRTLPPVTRVGQVVLLGSHRLLCGNALESGSYEKLLLGACAQMCVTDMPYNVPVSGHVCGLGKVQHREFAMASGEMSAEEFTTFMARALGHIISVCQQAAIIFAFMDWRHIQELLAAAVQVQLEYKNLCVWSKTNAGMGAFYRSQHELIGVFKNGVGKHVNNFGLGEKRYRTNVWTAPGVNTFRPGRMRDLEAHPTCKPTSLYADMMLDCSKRGGLIIDPFAGSGTIFLAAERTGRIASGIELDPAYCDVAIQRWQDLTGDSARYEDSGLSFNELRRRQRAPRLLPRASSPDTEA